MQIARAIQSGLFAAVAVWSVSTILAAEPELLGSWMLDEGQGEVAADRSGRGHQGRLVGASWASTRPQGHTMEFDGIKAHVAVPHREDLNLTHELTIMAWIFPLDLSGEAAFLVKGRDHGTGYMFLRDGAQLWFRVATERTPGEGILGPAYSVLKSDPILQNGQWQHVAAVYSTSGGKATLYYNGRKILEKPADGRIVYREPKLPLNLGAMSYPGYWQWHGFLRDVRLYAAALDDRRIKECYQSGQNAMAQLVPISKEDQQAELPSRIKLLLVDKQTGKPLDAKVFVKDAAGRHYWPKGSLVYGLAGPRQCFFASGSCEVPVSSGKLEIAATCGFEYLPLATTVDVAAGGHKELRCALERLADMPSKGWYGGEHHLHPTGHSGRRYDQRMTMATRSVICKAEGMHFAFWMGPRGHDIERTDQLADPWSVDGKLGQLFAAEGFVGQCCVEPTGLCGHRCVLGSPYWTVRRNPHFECLSIFDQVDRQGGLCIFSHPYAGGVSLQKDSGLCFARELPLAVALGRARIWDLLCWGGSMDEKLRDWYRWLNLGFRLGIGGSTDCYMNDPAKIIAPGANRTYVKSERLTIPDLVKAYRQGCTVATSGPLLVFTVDGRQLGDVIQLDGDKPRLLRLRLESHSVEGIERVEVLENGSVVKTVPGDRRRHLETDFDLEIGRSCWLAARVTGVKGERFGTFAHTSPIYVQFGRMPMKAKPEDVEYFVDWLEGYRRAIQEFAVQNKFPATDYAELLTHLDEATGVYRHRIASPRCWTGQP